MTLSNEDLSEYRITKTYMSQYPNILEREAQHKALIAIWDKRHVTMDWRLRRIEELSDKVGKRIPIDWEGIRGKSWK
jgi:hypothetical protein